MDARPILGRSGEDAAARLLQRQGFRIVERNYRCRHGEIDVIARGGQTLVFCEVKARTTDQWGDPSEAVNPRKQARIRRLAAEWLRTRRVGADRVGPVEVRFDVVSVIVRDGRMDVRHIPDAF